MGALDGLPFHLAGLPGHRAALAGGIVLGHGLGANLVQPDIAIRAVRLLRLEAHSEIAGFVRSRADQHAVVIDLVAEDHFLDGQRNVRHFGLEAQIRVGIQGVEFHIIGILHIRVSVFGGNGCFDGAGEQLKLTVGVAFLGIGRQRRDDHVFQTDGRSNLGRSNRGSCHGG